MSAAPSCGLSTAALVAVAHVVQQLLEVQWKHGPMRCKASFRIVLVGLLHCFQSFQSHHLETFTCDASRPGGVA